MSHDKNAIKTIDSEMLYEGKILNLRKDIIETDIILVAVGVSGNISNLGLENLNIKIDRGFISTNKHMQSNIANVYAKQSWDSTEILAASIRNVRDVGRAFEYGAHICTIPTKVFEGMYKHVLTDQGLALFDKDYAQNILDLEVGK